MGVLENLAMGLRQAGGVLNPAVQGILSNEASQDEAFRQKLGLMQLQRQMEMQGPEYQTKLLALESAKAEGEKRARLGALVRTPEWAAANPRQRLEMAASQGLIDPVTMAKDDLAAHKPVAVGAGGLAVPDGKGGYNVVGAKPQAPVTRKMRVGPNEVTQQWNDKTGEWDEIASGPAFARQVAPVVVTGGDGKSKYTNIQPDGKGGWVGLNKTTGVMEPVPSAEGITSTKEKPLPAGAASAMLTNQQNLRRAELALSLIEGKKAGSLNGDKNATGLKNYLGETIMQRLDPEGIDTRAAIADLGSLVIHERSGAAVTAAEFPRLRPFIPQATDDPATVQKKLKRFVQVYREVVEDSKTFYRDQGFKVNDGSAVAPATPQPAPQEAPGKNVRIRLNANGEVIK